MVFWPFEGSLSAAFAGGFAIGLLLAWRQALAGWMEASEARAAICLRQDSEVVSKIGRVLTVRVIGKSIQRGRGQQPYIWYSYYVEGVEGWGSVSVTISGSRDAPVYAIRSI